MEATNDQSITALPGRFAWLPLEEIADIEIEDAESSVRVMLQDLLEGRTDDQAPFLQLGWTEDLLRWIGRELPYDRIDIGDEIEQVNASSSHTLLKIRPRHGPPLWFKAVAESPHESTGNEYVAVTMLSNLLPTFLPTLLGVRTDWNGWLMRDGGASVEESGHLEAETAETIGKRLAEMQQASIPHLDSLLGHGFTDQRIPALRDTMLSMMPYLEEAVLSQRSDAIPAIEIGRLKEIAEIFEEACFDLEEIGIPDTVVHNDLNGGNILVAGDACVFTDWAQAGVGNPLVALDQLQIYLAQGKTFAPWCSRILHAYREQWRCDISEAQIDLGLRSVRLVSIATHLTSRWQWLESRYHYNPGLKSYIRSLVRQMDKTAQSRQCVGVQK